MRHSEWFKMRVSPDQKAAYEAQAEKEGLPLSQWVRTTLDARCGMVGGVKHVSVKDQMAQIFGGEK